MDAADPQPPAPRHGKYEIQLPTFKRPGEPDRYRLSEARLAALAAPKIQPPAHPIHFWLRTRYVSALAAVLSSRRPHILALHLRPSRMAGFLGPQKQGEDEYHGFIQRELFDTEVKAYNRLRPLQGVVIPKCYGLCYYRGTRALLLEHLPGVSLASPEGSTLTLEQLSALLQSCYRAIQAFGVHHEDPHMENFQLVDGRIMALDFERVEFDLSEDDMEHFLKTSVVDMAYRYRSMQAYHRRQGALEAA
ncbi:lipopolysaccharide core heptose(II) kinase RfaY [Achaetomium macrosporum]|uniref:Lipopolysaccharide core heptose(II) kinase RfaY n=1 Tax=Achaetomium macrosporum TaxID=79813 RepID=A0AAN7H9S8_9PEZI|nr:lipopolysaccharide core heptose(II) kinase RfaY [Achaetomium macrosporum]